MNSKSWISTQIQDWAQVIVFEMVYLLLRKVLEITRNIRGAQILTQHRSNHSAWLGHKRSIFQSVIVSKLVYARLLKAVDAQIA